MPMKTRARTAKADKKINEKFRKRRISLMNKADQLAKLCQANIYLVVSREKQHFTYSSTEKSSWPPSKDELSNSWPLTQHLTPQDFDDEKDGEGEDSLISTIEEDEGEQGEEEQVLDAQQKGAKRVITIALPPVFSETPIRSRFDLFQSFRVG